MTNKGLQGWVKEQLGSVSDHIRIRANGEVWIERDYYYRHGTSAHSFADSVAKKLHPALVFDRAEDRWNPWPKRSYFLAVFRRVS